MGKKNHIKCDDIKTLPVPQYEGLDIDSILEEANKDERVKTFLPDDRDMHKVPR